MSHTLLTSENILIPVSINASKVHWGIAGGGPAAFAKLCALMKYAPEMTITIIDKNICDDIRQITSGFFKINIHEIDFDSSQTQGIDMLVIATGNQILDEKILSEARQLNMLVNVAEDIGLSDFVFPPNKMHAATIEKVARKKAYSRLQTNSEQSWKNLTSKLILAFLLMVLGHILISYLPLPTFENIIINAKPYFNYQFLFFVLAGFLAQMVDGVLSMGYGVTSATCLMSFGVSPVAMSGAIHTSEIFTTGISGYSHYKFGNVNMKLFRHLVIPGVIGAVLGAVLLVFLNDQYGKWIMPIVAVYAGFLGLKILIKAFQIEQKNKKVKRIGWLAWVGGFLDSFGGGGWGPIVTSTLIAKGRSPKYTIGSVSLTEFFVTLSSAFTFFVTVGISNWNIVLGLLIGGGIAAPIAARLAGKLPRKTMMIAVGIMVMIWCIRMIVKSL